MLQNYYILIVNPVFLFFLHNNSPNKSIYIYIYIVNPALSHPSASRHNKACKSFTMYTCMLHHEWSLLNGCGPSCLSWVLTWPSPAFHMNANFLWRVGKSMNKNDIVSSFHHSLDIGPTFDQSPPDDSMPSVRHCRSSQSHNIYPFVYLVGNTEYIIFFIKKLFLYSN